MKGMRRQRADAIPPRSPTRRRRRMIMDIRTWGRKGILLCATIALALFGGLVLDRGTAGSPPTAGPQESVEPNVVLSGSYFCAYTVTSYYAGPPGDPNPPPQMFAETTDSFTLGTTGGNVPGTSRGQGDR